MKGTTQRSRVRRGLAALVVASVVWSLSTAVSASATPTGSIVGSVKSPGGTEVAGIEVYVYPVGTTGIADEAKTATNGSYEATGLSPGKYDISYFNASSTGSWLSGWYRNATSQSTATAVRVMASGETVANITIRHAGTISGTVTDPSGDPVGQIAVWAYPVGSVTDRKSVV